MRHSRAQRGCLVVAVLAWLRSPAWVGSRPANPQVARGGMGILSQEARTGGQQANQRSEGFPLHSMAPDKLPVDLEEYFDNLQVMIFSGSRHFSNPRTLDEFAHIADQCIRESHQRLHDSEDLVAYVCDTLSNTALMPWGTRLAVQGGMRSPTCTENEPGKVSEHLCLLRGPQSQGVEMGNYWIGIVRHDETSYMTVHISWLLKHITGYGGKRKLLFARDVWLDGAEAEVEFIWDNIKIDRFNELIGAT